MQAGAQRQAPQRTKLRAGCLTKSLAELPACRIKRPRLVIMLETRGSASARASLPVDNEVARRLPHGLVLPLCSFPGNQRSE